MFRCCDLLNLSTVIFCTMQYLEISLLCKILLSKFWHGIWQLAEAIPSDLAVENMAYVQTCGQTIRFSIWFSHPILIRLKPHRVTATLLNSLNQLWSKLLYMGSSQLNFDDFILNCTLIILFYITFKKKKYSPDTGLSTLNKRITPTKIGNLQLVKEIIIGLEF